VVCAVCKPAKKWLPPHARIDYPEVRRYTNSRNKDSIDGSKRAVIEWLVVDNRFRRKGVASMLLSASETFCRNQEHCKCLQLVCSSQQLDAVAFYKKLEYTTELEGNLNMLGEHDMYLRKVL
jgi:ribosomal protein S18 acetylase RimI-like enzyme